jgi:hypothetical protein
MVRPGFCSQHHKTNKQTKQNKKAGGVVQVEEHLSSKSKVLNSNPSTAPQKPTKNTNNQTKKAE